MTDRQLSEPFVLVASALAQAVDDGWFVGGAIRDELLGRTVRDVDVVVPAEARRAAQRVHAELGGDVFSLSDRFGTWRVLSAHGFQVDISELRADGIEADLAARDFTVNAIARPLGGGAMIDPSGGRADLERKLLRAVSEQSFDDDPLRLVRLVRLAVVLDFAIDPTTRELALGRAPRAAEPAPERTFAELGQIIGSDAALQGVELLDELGLLAAVLPELTALKGLGQTVYHHKDVWGHTLEVFANMLELQADGYRLFADSADELKGQLAGDLADGMSFADGLRWAALLHDVAKPQTRVEYEEGRVGFPRHDLEGAGVVRKICRRLRTSERFAAYVSALTREHMRLGFLVREQPLSARQVHRYLIACAPVEVEVGVLSVADRTATRGRKHEQAIPPHIELAVELTAAALKHRAAPPPRLLRGDQLAAELGIEPGPRIGQLLGEIAEAQYAGEVTTPEQALELARRAL